jgi:undecaprenyl-diphosphatase
MYDLLVIFCAKYLVFAVAAAGLLYIAFSPAWRQLGAVTALSLAVAFAVGKGLGLLWYDPLPFVQQGIAPLIPHAANNGFPSDHMLLAATAASIVFVYNRRLGLLLWVLAAAVGAARVSAGVHHPVDVLAAAVIAVGAVALSYWLQRYLPFWRDDSSVRDSGR